MDVATRSCEVCAAEFRPYRDWQTTCSRSCTGKAPKKEFPWAKDKEVTCRYCSTTFVVRATNGRHVHCPACRPAYLRDRQDRKNAARRSDGSPESRRKSLTQNLRRYGLTADELDAMVAAQGNRCAICGEPPDPKGIKAASRLHVDHCHTSGLNRALLCIRCNFGIGAFMEDPTRLQAAVEYLTKWKERHSR